MIENLVVGKIFATGKTGVGPYTNQPSFEGYCYYTDTQKSEFSKHWLQSAFDLDNPIKIENLGMYIN